MRGDPGVLHFAVWGIITAAVSIGLSACIDSRTGPAGLLLAIVVLKVLRVL